MAYIHKAFYTFGSKEHQKDDYCLMYSTEEHLDMRHKDVITAINLVGNRRDQTNGNFGNKLISINFVELLYPYVHVYGTITLDTDVEYHISELNPIIRGHELRAIENIFGVKNPIIISSDLKECTNKILWISNKGEFHSLTHKEITLLSSSNEEFDNYRSKFEAKALVKDLL